MVPVPIRPADKAILGTSVASKIAQRPVFKLSTTRLDVRKLKVVVLGKLKDLHIG
jgi:hypothetical protein